MRPHPSRSLAAERLQLVLELGRRVTSILDLDQLLPEACRLIAEAFGYDLVGINLLDPLDERRLYQAAAFPSELTLPRSFRVPLGRGMTGWVARHGKSRLANDVSQDPLYIPGPGRNTRSELDVPLKLGRRTIGVLNVESERLDAFSEDDVPYLEGLAGQLAQAIENARLAARLRQLAAAEERARLARDLHDETVQALIAIRRQLDLLELDLDERAPGRSDLMHPEREQADLLDPDLGDHDRVARRLEALHDLVDRTLEGVRRLSRNLRPAVLEDLGLVAALREHTAEMARLGLQVEVGISGGPRRLPAPTEYAVYRVAQEALSNVARHAEVGEARLSLDFGQRELVLAVEDRGVGFTPADDGAESAGVGLMGMRDRAAEIGAQLQVSSRPGRGTEVRLAVPLELTLL